MFTEKYETSSLNERGSCSVGGILHSSAKVNMHPLCCNLYLFSIWCSRKEMNYFVLFFIKQNLKLNNNLHFQQSALDFDSLWRFVRQIYIDDKHLYCPYLRLERMCSFGCKLQASHYDSNRNRWNNYFNLNLEEQISFFYLANAYFWT
jgi:hypothetical protein